MGRSYYSLSCIIVPVTNLSPFATPKISDILETERQVRMFAYCGWAILGLPIAYWIHKKYNRTWFISIMGGMSFVIIGVLIIAAVIDILQ